LFEQWSQEENMKKLSITRWCLVAALCASVAGCAGASWQTMTVSRSYHAPKHLNVSVIWKAKEDSTDALEALQEGLSDGLASKGIAATFVAAPGGEPQADVTVAEWDPGSRALRYLTSMIAGRGSIVVLVKSPSGDGQPGVEGTALGWVAGGVLGGSSDLSAMQAGHLIAEAIATGQTN
jgi:hypothetical protein